MRIVAAIMRNFETLATGISLGSAFVLILLGNGSLYVAIKRNNITTAFPAFTVACLGSYLFNFYSFAVVPFTHFQWCC